MDNDERSKQEETGGNNPERSYSRREFLKYAGLAGATIAVGSGLGGLLSACGTTTTTTTTAGTATTGATATTAATAATETTQVSAAAQSLKIGMIYDNSFPLHVQWKNEMDILIPDLNSKGGLTLGNGQKYNVNLIPYDGKRDSETSRSAAQRLISEDKVAFILGDESTDYWMSLTEAAKVLVTCETPSPGPLKPENKYTYQATFLDTQAAAVYGWVTENRPFKTICGAHPDNLQGHAEGEHTAKLAKLYGQEVLKEIYYPAGNTDFSAIATTLIGTGADVFTTCGGGNMSDSQLFKAMHQGGFKGMVLSYITWSIGAGSLVVTPDNFNNMVCVYQDTDHPNPPTLAKELMDLYTAKYGKWDYPAVFGVLTWYLLKSALEKSQSLDVDAVKAVIETPLEYDSPAGKARMVSRPDLGTSRPCDTLWAGEIAECKDGQYQSLVTLSFDQAFAYNKKAYNWQ